MFEFLRPTHHRKLTTHRSRSMSQQISNIHDGFFKQVLGDPGLAGTFLREHLPPDVADLLGPEPPEPVPGSFVDEDLRQHHSDLLFRVQLKAGCQGFAYVLMEHKSTPDQAASWTTCYYDSYRIERSGSWDG